MVQRSVSDIPGWAQPEEASARDEEYLHHGNGLHSHKHIHSGNDFHYHRHQHAGGEEEHVHDADDLVHEEHPQHRQHHLTH